MPKSIRALPLRTFDTELRDLLDRQAAAIEVFRPEFLGKIRDPRLREHIREIGRELAMVAAEWGLCRSIHPGPLQALRRDRLRFSLQLHLYCIVLLCHRAQHSARSGL